MVMEIEMKLRKILKDCVGQEYVDKVAIISNKDQLTSLGINSLIFVKIILAIEDEFGFEFDNDNLILNKLMTLNDFVRYIESKIN